MIFHFQVTSVSIFVVLSLCVLQQRTIATLAPTINSQSSAGYCAVPFEFNNITSEECDFGTSANGWTFRNGTTVIEGIKGCISFGEAQPVGGSSRLSPTDMWCPIDLNDENEFDSSNSAWGLCKCTQCRIVPNANPSGMLSQGLCDFGTDDEWSYAFEDGTVAEGLKGCVRVGDFPPLGYSDLGVSEDAIWCSVRLKTGNVYNITAQEEAQRWGLCECLVDTPAPTFEPTISPNPTTSPTTSEPTTSPQTSEPTTSPTTSAPSTSPTSNPTQSPTLSPSFSPSTSPSKAPFASRAPNGEICRIESDTDAPLQGPMPCNFGSSGAWIYVGFNGTVVQSIHECLSAIDFPPQEDVSEDLIAQNAYWCPGNDALDSLSIFNASSPKSTASWGMCRCGSCKIVPPPEAVDPERHLPTKRSGTCDFGGSEKTTWTYRFSDGETVELPKRCASMEEFPPFGGLAIIAEYNLSSNTFWCPGYRGLDEDEEYDPENEDTREIWGFCSCEVTGAPTTTPTIIIGPGEETNRPTVPNLQTICTIDSIPAGSAAVPGIPCGFPMETGWGYESSSASSGDSPMYGCASVGQFPPFYPTVGALNPNALWCPAVDGINEEGVYNPESTDPLVNVMDWGYCTCRDCEIIPGAPILDRGACNFGTDPSRVWVYYDENTDDIAELIGCASIYQYPPLNVNVSQFSPDAKWCPGLGSLDQNNVYFIPVDPLPENDPAAFWGVCSCSTTNPPTPPTFSPTIAITYFESSEPMSRQAASSFCSTVNPLSQLAEVKNEADLEATGRSFSSNVWIDGERIGISDLFLWSDGSLVQYLPWAPNNPVPPNPYLALRKEDGLFLNLDENESLPALCQLIITSAETDSPGPSPTVFGQTSKPTKSPVPPTSKPTKRPTKFPTSRPSKTPTAFPTKRPTSARPTFSPGPYSRMALFIQADFSRSIRRSTEVCVDDAGQIGSCWALIVQFVRNLVNDIVGDLPNGYDDFRFYLSAFTCEDNVPVHRILTAPDLTEAGRPGQVDSAIKRLEKLNYRDMSGTCPSKGALQIAKKMEQIAEGWPLAYFVVTDGKVNWRDERKYSVGVNRMKIQMNREFGVNVCGATVGRENGNELKRLIKSDCIFPAANFKEISLKPFAHSAARAMIKVNPEIAFPPVSEDEDVYDEDFDIGDPPPAGGDDDYYSPTPSDDPNDDDGETSESSSSSSSSSNITITASLIGVGTALAAFVGMSVFLIRRRSHHKPRGIHAGNRALKPRPGEVEWVDNPAYDADPHTNGDVEGTPHPMLATGDQQIVVSAQSL